MQDSLLQWFAQRFMDRRLSPRELLGARKLVYIGLVVLLLFVCFFWRTYSVDPQARDLAILEESRGEVELSGSLVRLTLTGSRGLATCWLWMTAIEAQKKNEWNELEFYVGALTKLQPHFVTPWLFQSWNLSYNVSVESDRPFDKYFYIARGIQLLAEGERRNKNIPEMRFYPGFYTQHKICISDETNVLRSLFQLSMIPPSERDPARFTKRDPDGTTTINYEELEAFCKKNPRLVRRLAQGIRRDEKREQDRQFVCVSAQAVLDFLAKNWRVPSRYQDVPLTPRNADWQRVDAQLWPSAMQRFPVLPPSREVQEPQQLFKPADGFIELTDDATLDDSIDGQAVARAWYGYAQEPVPPPDDLPGSTQPAKDPYRQRKPKQMATLLFRQYPALTQTHLCQNLQQEGWFDDEPWPIRNWFNNDVYPSGGTATVALSEGAASAAQWRDCHRMWDKHARANHMLFNNAAEELNTIRDAEAYWAAEGMPRNADPVKTADQTLTLAEAELPVEQRELLLKERERLGPDQKRRILVAAAKAGLTEEKKRQFEAALFLYELNLYKSISNFQHHYHASAVESKTETVTARKLFAKATLLYYEGVRVYDAALATYLEPDAMLAWRDKVLAWPSADENREFRNDMFVQETTAEVNLDYLKLAQDKEEQYRRRIFNTAQTLALLAQRDATAAAMFCPVPLDFALASGRQDRLKEATFFPRPFDVPVLNLDGLPMFVPAFLGANLPGSAHPVGTVLLTAAATRPLIPESVVTMVEDRRRGGQPAPQQPGGPPTPTPPPPPTAGPSQ